MEVVMDMSVMAMDMMITRATGTRVTAMDMMTIKAMGTRVMDMDMMTTKAMGTKVMAMGMITRVMDMDMMTTIKAMGTRAMVMDMMTTKDMGTRVMAMGMMIIRAMDTRVTMDMAIMNITTNMCTTIEQKQINHILVLKTFFPFLWVKIENVTSKKEEVRRMVGNDCPSDL